MELIDRYVYAVTKRLPERSRADVDRELRANIDDMLPDGFTEQDVREVLNKIGNPATLADEYSEGRQYLIGPGLYDSYLSVLRVVASVVISVVTVVTVADYFVGLSSGVTLLTALPGALMEIVGAIVGAAVSVFGWITVTFALLERSGVVEGQLPFAKGEWSLNDLEPVPDSHAKTISRGEVAFEMIWTALWASVLIFAPASIGWYSFDNGRLTGMVPLLDVVVFRSYLPAVLAVVFIGLVELILKLVYGRWNAVTAAVNAASNLLFLSVAYVMLSSGALFNSQFFARLAETLSVAPSGLGQIASWAIWVSVGTIVVACIGDSISGFLKARQNQRIPG